MIEFKNVYKAYKNKPVLSNISLTIQDDEFFVLIGSSGQGFTVLMTPQMWMRDGGFEVYNYVPVEPELADFSGIMGFDSGEDWDE